MRFNRQRSIKKQKGQSDFWQSANRLLVLLIFVGLLVLIAAAFYPEILRTQELKDRLAQLREEQASEELLLLQQQRTKELIETNPEYLESLARDKLDLMKDGETIFRLDKLKSQSETSPPNNSTN